MTAPQRWAGVIGGTSACYRRVGTYPLADTAEGLRHVERGHARGKAVISVGPAGA